MKKFVSVFLIVAILMIAIPTAAFAATPTGTNLFSATLQTDMKDSAGNSYYGKNGTWVDAGNGKYAFVIDKVNGGKIYCADKYYRINGIDYWFSGGYTTTKPVDPSSTAPVGPGYQPVGPTPVGPTPVQPPVTYTEHWEGKSGSWKFVKSNGKYAANEFISWNGDKYYLDPAGVMVTGKYSISNTSYLFSRGDNFHPEGSLLKNEWLLVDGYWYYSNSNGVVKTNSTITWNNNKYRLGTDGKMLTGLTKIDGNLYYFNDGSIGGLPYGAMLKSSWLYVGGYYYYFGSDGIAYKNTTRTINGYSYRFDKECRYY